ncbi:hypothetical protein Ancab_011255 [Ancistrocladus abbreviatus]
MKVGSPEHRFSSIRCSRQRIGSFGLESPSIVWKQHKNVDSLGSEKEDTWATYDELLGSFSQTDQIRLEKLIEYFNISLLDSFFIFGCQSYPKMGHSDVRNAFNF